MLHRFFWIAIASCLLACAPVNPITQAQFEAAHNALAANDAFLAADWLAVVVQDDNSPELKKKAQEILHGHAFGLAFMESYLGRVPNMDVKDFVSNTDLLFTMLFINPALSQQGDTVWNTFCAKLSPQEGKFPVTARVGERLPCRDDAAYAERIYGNSVAYLRNRIDEKEFNALARFAQDPKLTRYTARLQQDLPNIALDRSVVKGSSFRDVAGVKATSIIQGALPGYALKFAQRNATFERYVREHLDSLPDIRPAKANEPNTVYIEVTNINLHTEYSEPIREPRWYLASQCWPSVAEKMHGGNAFGFTLVDTVKDSIFTATARLSVNNSPAQSVPLQFTVRERSISCEDFAIELRPGVRANAPAYGSINSYANSEMASLCSRNREYLSTRAVWKKMAEYLAEGITAAVRTLKK